MLFLARKLGEAIRINGNIIVRVEEIKGNQIRLGFDCPKSCSIFREEVYQDIQQKERNSS